MDECTRHKGHRRYFGGLLDGHTDHLVHADPSDYPRTMGTLLSQGQRSWYELDDEKSHGAEAVYRFIGHERDFPVSRVDAL